MEGTEDEADGWKTKGITKGKGKGKSKGKGKDKGTTKAQKISNTIAQIFKEMAMEGAEALEAEVHAFFGKAYVTQYCKKVSLHY